MASFFYNSNDKNSMSTMDMLTIVQKLLRVEDICKTISFKN